MTALVRAEAMSALGSRPMLLRWFLRETLVQLHIKSNKQLACRTVWLVATSSTVGRVGLRRARVNGESRRGGRRNALSRGWVLCKWRLRLCLCWRLSRLLRLGCQSWVLFIANLTRADDFP